MGKYSLRTLLPRDDMIGLCQRKLSLSGIGLSKGNRCLPNKAQTLLKSPPPLRCVVIRETCMCVKPLLDNLPGEIEPSGPPYYHKPTGDGRLTLRWGGGEPHFIQGYAFFESWLSLDSS